RLTQVRAGRDEARCRAALEALTEAAQNPPRYGEGDHAQHGGEAPSANAAPTEGAPPPPFWWSPSPVGGGSNLLALAIKAARADATLGEVSAALEEAFGRYGTLPTPV